MYKSRLYLLQQVRQQDCCILHLCKMILCLCISSRWVVSGTRFESRVTFKTISFNWRLCNYFHMWAKYHSIKGYLFLEQNNDDFAEKWPRFLFGVPTFTYLILLIILSICVFFYQIYSFGLLAMSHFTFSCEYLFQVIKSKCKFYTCREVLQYWHKSKV